MPVTRENVAEVLSYHTPAQDQLESFARIRVAATAFAEVILDNTRSCADQSAALRHVREAMMTANAAVALRGLV